MTVAQCSCRDSQDEQLERLPAAVARVRPSWKLIPAPLKCHSIGRFLRRAVKWKIDFSPGKFAFSPTGFTHVSHNASPLVAATPKLRPLLAQDPRREPESFAPSPSPPPSWPPGGSLRQVARALLLFYFCSRYRSAGPRALSPFFELNPGSRELQYAGDDRFNLAYFRPTGQWWEVRRLLSLKACLAEIRAGGLFTP